MLLMVFYVHLRDIFFRLEKENWQRSQGKQPKIISSVVPKIEYGLSTL